MTKSKPIPIRIPTFESIRWLRLLATAFLGRVRAKFSNRLKQSKIKYLNFVHIGDFEILETFNRAVFLDTDPKLTKSDALIWFSLVALGCGTYGFLLCVIFSSGQRRDQCFWPIVLIASGRKKEIILLLWQRVEKIEILPQFTYFSPISTNKQKGAYRGNMYPFHCSCCFNSIRSAVVKPKLSSWQHHVRNGDFIWAVIAERNIFGCCSVLSPSVAYLSLHLPPERGARLLLCAFWGADCLAKNNTRSSIQTLWVSCICAFLHRSLIFF